VQNTISFLTQWDIVSGLIKASVFGFIVALMGAYHGYNASGGARGVGQATTYAMVSAGILVFAADYIMTSLFSGK
jgi:phospholipid/cholesterol/gamma-HCH transport system permease protein